MPLYIRDDEVHALAGRLAALKCCTVADAVRGALKDALAKVEDQRAAKRARIEEALARLDALPDRRPGFTDRDLYDEDGLPVR